MDATAYGIHVRSCQSISSLEHMPRGAFSWCVFSEFLKGSAVLELFIKLPLLSYSYVPNSVNTEQAFQWHSVGDSRCFPADFAVNTTVSSLVYCIIDLCLSNISLCYW